MCSHTSDTKCKTLDVIFSNNPYNFTLHFLYYTMHMSVNVPLFISLFVKEIIRHTANQNTEHVCIFGYICILLFIFKRTC